MPEEIKNVFISHIHEDDEGLKKVKSLLKDHGISIRDHSVNSDKPNQAKSEEYIKSEILAPRIKQCGALLVYITADTKDSSYVNWEIEYAIKHGIRVVGVWAYGEKGCEVPKALEDLHDAIVGWNGAGIVSALTGEFDGWENPDGTKASDRDIKHYSCGSDRVT